MLFLSFLNGSLGDSGSSSRYLREPCFGQFDGSFHMDLDNMFLMDLFLGVEDRFFFLFLIKLFYVIDGGSLMFVPCFLDISA